MGVTHGRVLMWNKIPSQKSVELLCNLLPPSLVIASTLNHNPLFNISCNFTQVPLLNYPLHSQLGTAPLKRDLCSIRKDQMKQYSVLFYECYSHSFQLMKEWEGDRVTILDVRQLIGQPAVAPSQANIPVTNLILTQSCFDIFTLSRHCTPDEA